MDRIGSGLIVPIMLAAVLAVIPGCVTINLPPGPGPLKEEVLSGTGGDKILLVDLSGVISSQEKDGFISQPSMLSDLKEQLELAAKDDRIKGLLLRINSPGGTVTASDILYHEILSYKRQKKVPVVASIVDVGASGGYYVAAAADAIMAHPSSVTGSLGVIMLTVNARGLLEKVGVEANAVTSGPRKDMGSPFRAMSPEEREIFQGVIDQLYRRFLTVIHEGRPNLSPEQIRKLADGRIYTGEQAKEAGLIDAIGYLDDAVELAKKRGKVSNARVVTYRRPGDYRNNIYSRLAGQPNALSALPSLDLFSLVRGGTPQFMYLWMP
ncbi:Signal peptide peptidase SppA [Nitrospira tepida]|uniref:Signal peptide peptidase SppA n=1 Tax=Nitrospira tepida TaxID=2973512 RepID=A0AA86N0Z0_9BACT|nr:signal peptide peptidase SppA [Nitrospira tepida]CAI4032511.1 Signal peptide peptidase SppA [Nitrospira tepida]